MMSASGLVTLIYFLDDYNLKLVYFGKNDEQATMENGKLRMERFRVL